VLAYVLGRRRDEVFLKLKNLLEPFEITRFYTDDWWAISAISIPSSRLLENKTHIK